MATKATATRATLKATTAAPAPVAPVAAPVIVATGATLYTYQPYNGATNTGWPLGQRGHRAFACQVAQALAKAQPQGFTLTQFKAALVASAAASPSLPVPNGGWLRHNMPQWAQSQKWVVPVGNVQG
jgi:hypothetical protein